MKKPSCLCLPWKKNDSVELLLTFPHLLLYLSASVHLLSLVCTIFLAFLPARHRRADPGRLTVSAANSVLGGENEVLHFGSSLSPPFTVAYSSASVSAVPLVILRSHRGLLSQPSWRTTCAETHMPTIAMLTTARLTSAHKEHSCWPPRRPPSAAFAPCCLVALSWVGVAVRGAVISRSYADSWL